MGQSALHGSAAIIAENLIPISEVEPPAIESASFQRHFERLGRIEFPDSVLIGSISRVAVDSRGRLLILDSGSREVLLVNPDGSLLKKLSPEACDPGLNWTPNDVLFSPDNEILVMNGARDHVTFNEDGECSEVLDLGIANRRVNVYSEDGDVYALYSNPNNYTIKHYDADSGETEELAPQTKMSNFLGRIIAGGMVQDASERLYLALPFRAEIQVFEPDGTDLGLIGEQPEYYRPVTSDLPEGVSGDAFIEAMNGIMSSVSVPLGLHLLDENVLLVPILNNYEDRETSDRAMALHVVGTDGSELVDEPILLRARALSVVGARDGLLLDATEPVADKNGDYGNQGLEVYRFIG